ncbi:Tetratricopeptide repeat protein 37 [Dinochytrium kinnereticum]|nr:Tetratricopeptide repeat protein 37 [Dinochytrium kinnereticum]
MDAKSRLRAAKEAIGRKDFAASREIAASVISDDPENFNALIFFGLSTANLGLVSDSEDAYKKAIVVNSTSPLPYQGLVSLFEKNPDADKLLQSLELLSGFYEKSNESQKLEETLLKMAGLYEKGKKIDQALSTYERLGPFRTEPGAENFAFWTKLLTLQNEWDEASITKSVENWKRRLEYKGLEATQLMVEKEVLLKSNAIVFAKKALHCKGSNPCDEELLATQSVLLELLWKKLRLVEKDEKEIIWNETYSTASAILQEGFPSLLALQILVESEDADIRGRNKSYFKKAAEFFPSGPWSLYSSGYLLWLEDGKASAAVDKFLEGLELAGKESSYFPHIVLMQLCLETYAFDAVLSHALQAEDLLNDFVRRTSVSLPTVSCSISTAMGNAYINLGGFNNLNKAISIFSGLQTKYPDNQKAKIGYARALCNVNRLEEAKACLEGVLAANPIDLDAETELAWVLFKEGDYVESEKLLLQVVAKSKTAASLHKLACIYWERGGNYRSDKQYVYGQLLQAIKLDSEFAPAFTMLGKYFQLVEGDLERAERCFEKSLRMNKLDVDAAEHICELYVKTKKFALYSGVLKRANIRDAITSFQSALRLDSRNTKSWEGLGEAYYKEGKFLASLKAFTRATDLKPSFNTFFLLGLTNRRLGMLIEAAENFGKCTKMAEADGHFHYPSLKALAETFYFRSLNEYTRGAFGLAYDFLLKSLSVILDCIAVQTSHTLYGFLGTVLLSFVDLKLLETDRAGDDLYQLLDNIRDKVVGSEASDDAVQNDEKLFATCISTLRKAVVVCQKDSRKEVFLPFYWYELSRAHYFRGIMEAKKGGKQNTSDADIRCVMNAIALDQSISIFWNAVGVFLRKRNLALCQHALIKAMEANGKASEPWCNFGLLCISEEDLHLGQLSFAQVQIIDSESPLAWFGQAIIADRQLKSKEAFDLTLYASDLNFEMNPVPELHLFASFKFLKDYMKDKRETSSLLAGFFSIQKYVELHAKDVAGLNLLGLFLERLGMHENAVKAFEQCLAILGLSEADDDKGYLASVVENYARVLFQHGDIPASCTMFAKALSTGSDAYTLFCYGKSLFFDNQLQESLQALNMASDALAGAATAFSASLKAELSLFLAQVLYCCGSDDYKALAAKQLHESASACPEELSYVIWSSLLAISLMLGDNDLAQESSKELQSRRPAVLDSINVKVAELLSRYAGLSGLRSQAHRSLVKVIHLSPSNPGYWSSLTKLVMRDSGNQAMLPSVTDSLHAIENFNRRDKSFMAKDLCDASRIRGLSSLVRGSKLSKKTSSPSKRILYQSVAIEPSRPENWVALAIALRSEFLSSFAEDLNVEGGIELLRSLRKVASSGILTSSKAESDDVYRNWLQLLMIDSTSLEAAIADEPLLDVLQECVAECLSLCEIISSEPDRNHKLQASSYITLGRLLLLTGDIQNGLAAYKKAIGLSTRSLEEMGYIFESYSYLDCALLCYKAGLEGSSSSTLRSTYIIRSACIYLQKNDLDAVNGILTTLLDDERRQTAVKFIQVVVNLRRGGSALKKTGKIMEDIRAAEDGLIADSMMKWVQERVDDGLKP